MLAHAGAAVESLAPGFDPVALWQAWLVWRRALVAPGVAAVLAQSGTREKIKAEALWEHDGANSLTFAEFMRSSVQRSAFLAHMAGLLERFDALALPLAQAWPFDAGLRWPQQIAGRAMDSYHRWMEVTLYATFAGLPAISVPIGFDDSGRLPMGLQLIGKPGGDAALLQLAALHEQLFADIIAQRPPEPA